MKKDPKQPAPRPNTLRWAISLALLTSSTALAQGGLQPAPGPGGTPIINNGHGVPVIDIVAPNPHGLSHNQFLDYNVGKPGVVLNNALQAGQSQLAGALAANPQFQGQAASTILNEVISRNASLIEGPQEIFGRPADYILANPNGITLNGGSFINTTRAGFLVGTPVVQEQQLKYLDTLQASGSLQVLGGGQSNAEGALGLIAPRIDSQGLLSAKTDLDLTVGRNRIDAASGHVLRHLPGTPSSIDAKLFGAMRAGRIRVLSTAEGAGVRMGPIEVAARDGISIRSAGDLQIDASATQGARLHSEHGALSLSAADDLRLLAVDGKAQRIEVKAGKKLTLDASTRENIERDNEKWNKKAWFITTETYDRERTVTTRTRHGTHLQAGDDLTLQSGSDMRLVAATVQAGGDLDVASGGKLDIEAGIDSRREQEQVRHRKHLWRGDRDTDDYKETAKASALGGERVTVKAGDTLRVRGSRLESRGEMELSARQVEVTTAALQENGKQRDYRGDLVSGTFFGDRNGNDRQGQAVAGSVVAAVGDLHVSAEQVVIKGSSVTSEGDAVLYSEKGLLAIEADQGSSTSKEQQSDSKLFGLIGSKRDRSVREEQVLVSDVTAKSNLRLASAAQMKLRGAKLEAGGHLQLEAKGDLSIDSAQSRLDADTVSQQRGFTANARQTQEAQDGKPDSRQFEATAGYQVATTTTRESETTQVASELKGASVALNSGEHLQVNGSKVTASAGDLSLQGKQVTLGATRNERNTQTDTRTSGAGLTVTGGIDRLGSAFTGEHVQDTQRERDSQVQRSELQASGDVKINATNLVTEAAKVDAGKQLLVEAEHIDNRAVQDIQEREHNTEQWRGSLGADVEYRDLTRPIERLVQGQEAARFQQASPEDAMAPPSVGAQMTVDHLKRLENQRRGHAQVSELSGATVAVKANTLDDQGTAWRAKGGQLKIDADRHHARAAENVEQSSVQRLAYGGELRVDTSTGQDINVRAAGKGGSLDKQASASTARPVSLQGHTGVQIQLGSDGRYEGTTIDGGNGDVSINSAGRLSLTQANDRSSEQSRQLDGNAWAKGGNRPTSTGLDARGYLDHAQRQSQDSKTRVAQIDAKGDVVLSSGGDMLLEGTRIGSRERKVDDIRLDSGGVLQVKAASDAHQASGSKLGGGLELSAKTGSSKGGGIGGHFEHGKLDERGRQAVDAHFNSAGALQMNSRAREDIALHLQGLQASAAQIALNAANGGIRIEASGNQEYRNNLAITAGAGFNTSKGETPDKDVRGLHGRVQVDLDKRDNQTWNGNTWRAERISLHSRGDTRIEGASLEAGQIQGNIGGDLRVASRKDRVDNLSLKVDARLSKEKNPQGYVNAASAVAGPAGGKVSEKVGPTLSKAEPGLSPTFKLDLSHEQRDTVAHQASLRGSEGIDLKVGGDAHLVGARLQSAGGTVDLAAASVSRETLTGRDYRRDVSVDASNSPVDLGTGVAEVVKDKGAADGENALDLGLLRTSGHDRREQWSSSVQGKVER
ncbi:hemagglutinin repeat-containing protein [Pseudomonas sp. HLMP]|uniref:hemagglutinin repeat-containing protein n=1 Tax=Pseudomonas sp. HLMP TaxID=3153767 RepID=UPI00396792FA